LTSCPCAFQFPTFIEHRYPHGNYAVSKGLKM
jgi:hypothetical protein